MTLTARTATRIDELVASAQSEGRVPTLVLGVVRDGQLAHVSAAGDVQGPAADTQYRIGSITKTFTATLVMRLRDEGRLGLGDPLERHLPGTPVGQASIRQLLGHASGIRREPGGPWWEREPGVPLDTLLESLDEDLLVHPPYRTHHYSNLAYALLGAVVSRITGEAWVDLVAKRLLAPLGMSRTTYHCEEPFARGYVVHPWHGTLREEPRHDSGAMAPAGQLWSTIADLACWAGFLAAPSPGVINPDTVAEMTVPVMITDPGAWTDGYGLGLQLTRRGERILVGHGGSIPGYLAKLLVHRSSGTGVTVFGNVYNAGVSLTELCGEVIEEILEREPTPAAPMWRPATAPPEDIAPLCGRWWFMGLECEATYDPGREELVIRSMEGGSTLVPWRFLAESPDVWRCVSGMNDGERLIVCRGPDGAVTALDIATFEFTRDPLPDI